ncbi:nucleolin-like [Halichoeres trimaculatus]|uniref:nucleolin-like n=1 Tax=Halichoeres trimaculatus TaxID=147232 RepID=UPI003D9E5520
MATRRSKRQSKGVKRVELEETDVDTDPQVDMAIEVKRAEDTVTVKWDEKKKEEIEKDTDASNQIMITGEEQGVSTTDGVDSMESKVQQEVEEPEDEASQMDTTAEESESTTTLNATEEMKDDEEESDDVEKKTDRSEEVVVKIKAVKGKRKAKTVETSPPKKTKLITDGFCLYVGNLNDSRGFQELKNSLAKYFMSQSLLFQDIILDRSRKYAHIHLASQMDLTKALTLDGEMMLDKPMKIEVAKAKSEEKVKVKVSPEEKKAAKDARCLFLKNVPFDSTKEEILKSFHRAATVRFPGGGEHPNHGIAFVEFKNKNIAEQVLQSKPVVEIQGRVLIVDSIRPKKESEAAKTNDKNEKAELAPNNILYVSNLSFVAKEKNLKTIFPKAVSIKLPQNKGKSKGFAFITFATVADAEKALESSKNKKICQRTINVQFSEHREKKENVVTKTLVVKHLDENTTAETLQSAFEGALSARIILDKETKVSKRYGFVEFESEKESELAKKAMEHCEIDGKVVTIAYAQQERVSSGGRAASGERAGGQPAGQETVKGLGAKKGGKGRGAGSKKQSVKKKIKNKD